METDEEVKTIRRVVILGTRNDGLEERIRLNLNVADVLHSKDGNEFLDGEDVAFVLDDFEGPEWKELSSNCCIYGRTALEEILRSGARVLTRIYRPLFAHSMAGLILCFSGYRSKEELKKFLFWVHSMGGSVRKDFVTKVTHLVSADCSGDKYRYAATFGIPIVSGDWLRLAWERRLEPGFKASNPELLEECKVKPFQGAKIYFYGVPENGEKERMVRELERNGGIECKDYKTEPCTHIVVDETGVTGRPPDVRNETYVVKAEWFWVSIQMDSCADEKMFNFSDQAESLLSPKSSILSPTTPGSHNRKRKRQNRKEIVNALAHPDPLPQFLTTAQCHGSTRPGRRSSVGDVAMLSMSGSFLDTPDIFGKESSDPTGLHSPPPTPQLTHHGSSHPLPSIIPKIDISQMSPRQQVFTELVQTESNYVNILKTIIEVFKKPLEDPDKIEGQFLNPTETKIIFSNLPPIYDLHSQMLADFTTIVSNWKDDVCIGNVFLKYADDLEKTYPPFVNFFETTKNCLLECGNAKPRFHAFLKVCQSKPECGRQTLTELLIRPVQRLPSISLLLNDLLKHTRKEKDHPDSSALEKALNKIKAVMTHINEDKRRTECQMHIFDIFNDIENCPPHLVSSHRNFFCRAEVLEIGATDELCGKGYDLSLFLFSDVLEISKRRSASKGLGFRSPSALSLTNAQGGHGGMSGGGNGVNGNVPGVNQGSVQGHSQHHSQKHVELMNLTAIKRVVDVPDSDEYQGIFALVCRSNQELKEKMFIFQLTSPDMEKIKFLKMLCRNIANTMCRPDPDTYLTRRRPEELELEPSDLNISNMSRAYVKLHRTKQKVGRAFSFNKTPTNALKRAVSSMISPLANRDRINSTPSGDLQAMRLSSCSNLLSAESPRSSRGGRFFSSPSKGSCVKTSTVSLHSADSATSPQKDGSFTIPRTPQQHCSRRPSFKFKSKTLSKKF
uniref:Protein ECT2like [Megachile rotundata] n=1 Tax=Lepeophtheirus salmonis TaxID=72036 RepID=A0A0K2SYG9_LEPSM